MKVSVWMSAYNHEKYISECLDSVLSQKTNFDFEIVLGEDCSTDRTREIVVDYKNRYPDKFKLFLPEKNIGMMEMDVATYGLCTGEYIALLNGDDLLTDVNKLQIQSDFLDDNDDTVMCYHRAEVENENDDRNFVTVYPESGEELTIEFLLKGYNPVMTPTVMIKKKIELPLWFKDMPYGDMPLYLLLAQKGKIKFTDKVMSKYRIHSSGQWQGDSVYKNLLKDIKFYEFMDGYFNGEYSEMIKAIFSQRYFEITRLKIKDNKYNEAKDYYIKLVSSDMNFFSKNKDDINCMYKILYEGEDADNYSEFLSREIKWRVD